MVLDKKYDIIFFDLDGTITDSYPGIKNSVVYALEKMGRPVPDETVLRSFIGPPLADSFIKNCAMDRNTAFEAIDIYREYYSETGLYENTVYPGLEDVLKSLKDAGKHLAVATSKAEPYAGRILRYFGLEKYFDFTAAATMDASRVEKTDIIRYGLSFLDDTKPSDVLMIGDRRHDAAAAAALGLGFIGVLYGYGSKEELVSCGARFFAKNAACLTEMIL